MSSIFQSNGACYDTCNRGSYAFAIVQGNQCWCSNYVPGTTTSVGNCNDNCPGYPAEQCGSSTNSLYGYISLLRNPSGTIGGSTTISQVVSIFPGWRAYSPSSPIPFSFLGFFALESLDFNFSVTEDHPKSQSRDRYPDGYELGFGGELF